MSFAFKVEQPWITKSLNHVDGARGQLFDIPAHLRNIPGHRLIWALV